MSRCLLCCFDRSNKPIGKPEMEVVAPSTEPAGTLDAMMDISANERKLIKETCDVIFKQRNIQNKSVAFLIAFFKRYPHHQRYFKMFRDMPPDDLTTIPLVENHGRRVMDQIVKLVQHIEEPDAVQEQLAWISMKHKPRKVRSRQFKDMLSMFVVFVGEEMGEQFTQQHEQAWQKWVAHIISMIEKEEAKGLALNGSTSATGDVSESGTLPFGTMVSGALTSETGSEHATAEPNLLGSEHTKTVSADEKSDNGMEKEDSEDKQADEANENANARAIEDINRNTASDGRRSEADSENVNNSAVEAAKGLKQVEPVIFSEVHAQERSTTQETKKNGDLTQSPGVLECDSINIDMISVSTVGNPSAPNDTSANCESISAVLNDNPALPVPPEDQRDQIDPDSVQNICTEAIRNKASTEEANLKSGIQSESQDFISYHTDSVEDKIPANMNSNNTMTLSDPATSTTNVKIHFSESKSGKDDTEVSTLDTNKNCGNKTAPKEGDSIIVRA